MLVVAIIAILIITSVGIFMMYRPKPTTGSEKPVVTETVKPPASPPAQDKPPEAMKPPIRSPGRRQFPIHWGPAQDKSLPKRPPGPSKFPIHWVPPRGKFPPKRPPGPRDKFPPGPRKFPTHWGPAPENQTKDRRKLPGGYGFGSTTLAVWIEKNMARDRDNAKVK